MRGRRGLLFGALALLLSMVAMPATATGQAPAALLVGPPGTAGARFSSIQAAVDAAHPGDWVLVAPGVYHEKGSDQAGVLVTTPGIHLRGMDRNRVILDGTNPSGTMPAGSPACPSDPAAQDFGPPEHAGGPPAGRSGIEVMKVDGTYVENLTVCNYLSSPDGDRGNQIWWNGGDGSGKIGMGSFWGSYLTATSTYFRDSQSAMAQYGIFSSNERGPGSIDQSFASNMGDSAYYVGACPDCNVVLSHGHARNSALGFSGTNAGGRLVIRDSEWDQNKAGIVPNSLNNDDAPPPQDGACPAGVSPPTGAPTCTVIEGNDVHDNNNPDVPQFGVAGTAPVGTGIELSGTRNDSVIGNRVEHNNSWGILTHDYPDDETPPPISHCQGGIGVPGTPVCHFPSGGNQVIGNRLAANGADGNPTDGDIGYQGTGVPGNCFRDNVDTSGPLTTDPPMLQSLPCPQPADNAVAPIELICKSSVVTACPSVPGVVRYPQSHGNDAVRRLMAMPPAQPTMPDPCAGAPPNAWCPVRAAARSNAGATRARSIGALPATGPRRSPIPGLALVVAAVGLALLGGWRGVRRRARSTL